MKKRILFVLFIILMGTYQNDVKATSERGFVTELAALRNVIEPPRFTQALRNMTVIEGESVELTAKVSGTRPLTVEYQKDGKELPPSKRVFGRYEESSGTVAIIILEVYMEDAGVYGIKVTNAAGSAESKCTLTVRERL